MSVLQFQIDELDNRLARLRAYDEARQAEQAQAYDDHTAQVADSLASVAATLPGPELHDYRDDGTDPGNCRVCHFFHTGPRLANGQRADLEKRTGLAPLPACDHQAECANADMCDCTCPRCTL